MMNSKSFSHIGLFEGIGGFSLAARWMGWNTIAWCEWNEFGQKVLKHHFPNAKPHGDITKTDFTIYRGQCDILTGGFPCQPYSSAGKRLGKEDERHLWPEMLRAIREIQPGYVVGENVRGLTNWNGGVVFDEVQADLEAEGYEVLPFLLPACAVNAPHRRDRIWFIAHSYSNGQHRRNSQYEINASEGREYALDDFKQMDITADTTGIQNFGRRSGGLHTIAAGLNDEGVTTNTENIRCECGKECDRRNAGELHQNKPGREQADGGESCGCSGFASNANSIKRCKGRMHEAGCQQTERHACSCNAQHDERNTWQNFPTQSPVCGGNDGLPGELDGITFSKWRNESIKAYGNAIVPQVAYQIFKAIQSVA